MFSMRTKFRLAQEPNKNRTTKIEIILVGKNVFCRKFQPQAARKKTKKSSALLPGLRSEIQGLGKVADQVLHILNPHRQANQSVGNPRRFAVLLAHL